MLKRPKVILLDLDDTLAGFDSETGPAWQAAVGRFCEAHPGLATPETIMETIASVKRWYWGDPERHRLGRANLSATRREVVRMAFERLGIQDEGLSTGLADDYCTTHWARLCLKEGALEVLAGLKAGGYRLALVTNGTSAEQRGKVARYGIEPYFEAIFIEEEMGFGKPEVRVFQHVLQTLGADAAAVWMVGDNLEWDVLAPKSLGIAGIWVDWRGRGLPEKLAVKPDAVIASVVELPALLIQTL